jgi:hypothetical protein
VLTGSLPGCLPYRHSTPWLVAQLDPGTEDPQLLARRQCAAEHWLYRIVPRHHCQLYPFDLGHWLSWALFGNEDDGIFGEEASACYRCDEPVRTGLALSWFGRNPLHNLFFYVLGTAGRPCHSEFILLQLAAGQSCMFRYHPCATTVFAGSGSSLFLALHGGLPFFSLCIDYGRQFQFYIGWRERGNFGIKLIPAKRRESPCVAQKALANEGLESL